MMSKNYQPAKPSVVAAIQLSLAGGMSEVSAEPLEATPVLGTLPSCQAASALAKFCVGGRPFRLLLPLLPLLLEDETLGGTAGGITRPENCPPAGEA